VAPARAGQRNAITEATEGGGELRRRRVPSAETPKVVVFAKVGWIGHAFASIVAGRRAKSKGIWLLLA
jgi:hypothetical protein